MNIQQIMAQAQNLQKKMQELEQKLKTVTVTGSAGGGMVKVTSSCKGEFKAISIDESLLSPSEKEMLEDLIIAALNSAKNNADAKTNEEMQAVGISPDMMKLPF